MPLQGKSLREPLASDADPGEVGRQQVLELLVRVWQRSEDGALRRAAGERSLLLAAVPIESLAEQLPALKAAWLNDADAAALRQGLAALGSGLWAVSLEKREPLRFERLS
ncbi:MAG: hypothetical protein RLZZ219_1810 [Cyanobacteriota bacterium]